MLLETTSSPISNSCLQCDRAVGGVNSYITANTIKCRQVLIFYTYMFVCTCININILGM